LELKVRPFGLASDDFPRNDRKVFKFKTGMAPLMMSLPRR
jgi:hypothetical protein